MVGNSFIITISSIPIIAILMLFVLVVIRIIKKVTQFVINESKFITNY